MRAEEQAHIINDTILNEEDYGLQSDALNFNGSRWPAWVWVILKMLVNFFLINKDVRKAFNFKIQEDIIDGNTFFWISYLELGTNFFIV